MTALATTTEEIAQEVPIERDEGLPHAGGAVEPRGGGGSVLISDSMPPGLPWCGGQVVPTRRGLDSSPAVFLWESRTTNVDVMSVSNTTRPVAVSR